jgi:protein-S-isoprenylcysteine O-methyltransferase Ste14
MTGIDLALAGKIVWALGFAGWLAMRFEPYRRSRRTASTARPNRGRERVLLALSTVGLCILPVVYVAAGWPRSASYPMGAIQLVLGVLADILAMWLFYRSHADLGNNWSASLEIRDTHSLVTTGIYQRLRHPMYAAFWCWSLAQALLLNNWIAGPAGLIVFALHFFLRVRHEEQMMLDRFGDDYRRYMARTDRVIPGIF